MQALQIIPVQTEVQQTSSPRQSSSSDNSFEQMVQKESQKSEPVNYSPENNAVNSENEFIPAKDLNESIEDQQMSLSFSAEISRSMVIQNTPKIETMEVNDNEKVVENLSESDLTYLKSSSVQGNSYLDSIISNAEEYSYVDSFETHLYRAQKYSLEEPVKFLAMSEENNFQEISIPVEAAAFAEGSQIVFGDNLKFENKSSEESYFKLEVKDGNKSVDAKSLFNEIFTVTDNRSVEQKIADFKKSSEFSSDLSSDSRGEYDFQNQINLTMTLSDNVKENVLSLNDQSAASNGSTFQQMLTHQISQSAPELVKAGSIVLRDNNSGTINMNLKPEKLGNVKISLEVSDKVITGNITVNSKEAFDAFKQNMDNLKQAFQENGFDNAVLNLNLADNSSQNFNGENFTNSEEFLSKQIYGEFSSGEKSSSKTVSAGRKFYETGSDRKISIVA